MKTEQKIKELVPEFRRVIDRVSKHIKAMDRVSADLAAFTKEEDPETVPDYNDTSAIAQEQIRGRQRVLCEQRLKQIESDAVPMAGDIQKCMIEAEPLIHAVLRPIVDRAIETTAKSLRPFSDSDRSAEKAAMKTDRVDRMLTRLSHYRGKTIFAGDIIGYSRHASRCLTVLEESLKDGGDLLQFLDGPRADKSIPAASPQESAKTAGS